MKITVVMLFLILTVNFLIAAVTETNKGIEFSYEAPNAQSVFLTGSFNDWNTTINLLKQDDDGIWKTVIKLSQGKHTYKFVVDNNWYFDPDNPNLEDDGYGGSNSLIEIGSDGKMVKSKNISISGVKSTLNPKIYFLGRYYTKNSFEKKEQKRYMLDKPEHDLNFGIKVKFNSNFEGYTVLNVNNTTEGSEMWKTHLNYKRSYLRLKTDFFNINAFDDFGIYTSDDPLHIIGDEGKYHYDFGYGYRGVFLNSSDIFTDNILNKTPLHINAKLLFADELGDYERDIIFGRLKLKYNLDETENRQIDLKVGGAFYNNKFKISEDEEQQHNSNEIDLTISKNIFHNSWISPINFVIQSEYHFFSNSNLYKNYGSDTLIVKEQYDWMDGNSLYLGSFIKFPAALEIYLNYLNNKIIFNLEENSNSIYSPCPDIIEEELSRKRFTIGADFEIEEISILLELQYWKNSFPDSLINWEDYYKYLEKTDGNGRWSQKYSEVPFEKYTVLGYETGLTWKANFNHRTDLLNYPISIGLNNTFAHQNFLKVPKYYECIFTAEVDIAKNWKIYSNTRIPYYNDDILGLKTNFANDEDVFISNYSEICYHLTENVRLSLGWGVSPRVINQVTDEFYDGGREEFLEQADNFAEYVESTYRGLGEKIRTAERTLMNEKRIVIEAVVEF